ncbi:hypothetical protein VTI28DRAFT_8431 [Corynascus sepedonium]
MKRSVAHRLIYHQSPLQPNYYHFEATSGETAALNEPNEVKSTLGGFHHLSQEKTFLRQSVRDVTPSVSSETPQLGCRCNRRATGLSQPCAPSNLRPGLVGA